MPKRLKVIRRLKEDMISRIFLYFTTKAGLAGSATSPKITIPDSENKELFAETTLLLLSLSSINHVGSLIYIKIELTASAALFIFYRSPT